MATIFAQSEFSGTDWAPLTSISPTKGGPVVNHPNESGSWYLYGNRALCRTAGLVYWSGTPASADYSVTADIIIKSSIGSTGVAGRISTTERTYYTAYIDQTTAKVVLAKRVAGTITTLNVSAGTYGIGTWSLTLDMVGTTIRALVGGTAVVTVTDASITAAGKAGIRAPVVSDAATGKHVDTFVATDTSVAPAGRSYLIGFVGL